jgi:hypothetical protein
MAISLFQYKRIVSSLPGYSLFLQISQKCKMICRKELQKIHVNSHAYEYVRTQVTGGWRKLHNEELHNLYSSPGIIRIIKLRRMRWAEHVA